jgi:hypothetical protein
MKSATAGWADFNCGYLFWILCEKVLQANPRGKFLNSYVSKNCKYPQKVFFSLGRKINQKFGSECFLT